MTIPYVSNSDEPFLKDGWCFGTKPLKSNGREGSTWSAPGWGSRTRLRGISLFTRGSGGPAMFSWSLGAGLEPLTFHHSPNSLNLLSHQLSLQGKPMTASGVWPSAGCKKNGRTLGLGQPRVIISSVTVFRVLAACTESIPAAP